MPQFKIRVTRVLTKEYDIDATSVHMAEELALAEFNGGDKIHDIETDTKDITPGFLDFQPEDDVNPQFYTHFDEWSDAPDETLAARWDWNSPQAVAQSRKLGKEWNKTLAYLGQRGAFDFAQFAKANHAKLGFPGYFKRCGEEFVKLGFQVWLSDTAFEVYAP